MKLEDISPSSPFIRRTLMKTPFDISSLCITNFSPPRQCRKRKSHQTCLHIPTKVLESCPDFFVPRLYDYSSKKQRDQGPASD